MNGQTDTWTDYCCRAYVCVQNTVSVHRLLETVDFGMCTVHIQYVYCWRVGESGCYETSANTVPPCMSHQEVDHFKYLSIWSNYLTGDYTVGIHWNKRHVCCTCLAVVSVSLPRFVCQEYDYVFDVQLDMDTRSQSGTPLQLGYNTSGLTEKQVTGFQSIVISLRLVLQRGSMVCCPEISSRQWPQSTLPWPGDAPTCCSV